MTINTIQAALDVKWTKGVKSTPPGKAHLVSFIDGRPKLSIYERARLAGKGRRSTVRKVFTKKVNLLGDINMPTGKWQEENFHELKLTKIFILCLTQWLRNDVYDQPREAFFCS